MQNIHFAKKKRILHLYYTYFEKKLNVYIKELFVEIKDLTVRILCPSVGGGAVYGGNTMACEDAHCPLHITVGGNGIGESILHTEG